MNTVFIVCISHLMLFSSIDTHVWCKLNTAGQLLPPRAGHTTVSFGKNLFVFGGFSDEQNLYDDVYMLDVGMYSNDIWLLCFDMLFCAVHLFQ